MCNNLYTELFIYYNHWKTELFSYPMASAEELAENSDNCAICWEKMETARKLPCTHLFHKYVACMQFHPIFKIFFSILVIFCRTFL
jgi:hypothetical protein